MDVGSINLPSIVYTSVDSGEGENFQSDDSADVAQSDDSVEAVQSDDSADLAHSDAAFMDTDGPPFIAPSLCHVADDESRQCLLDATSDNGSCSISPAVVPPFALHHHPLASFSPQIAATIANELCSSVVLLSDGAVPVTVLNSQHLYLPHCLPEAGTRSPTPSESSSQSSGSQEAVGLLSLHQYQPLCGTTQPDQQITNMDYTTLAPDHIISKMKCSPLAPLNTMLVAGKEDLVTAHDLNPKGCVGDRCMVGDINIDCRYRDAFYVSWNWTKIRHACAMAYLGVLLALFVGGVSLLVKMPQGHDCDPVRDWWQGGVSYHVLVPSFKDSNHDGIGDLQGIVSKLDYIEGLGVTMVRLAPIFELAESHYDTVLQQQDPGPTLAPTVPVVAWNLTRVDAQLGSSSEVQLLAALLHVRGMKLLLDVPLGAGLDTNQLPVPGVSAAWPPRDGHLSVAAALAEVRRSLPHWLRLGVDGFVFPDLHTVVTQHNALQVVTAVEEWRRLLDASPRRGQERILVLNTELVRALPDGAAPAVHHTEPEHLSDLTNMEDDWTTDGVSNETLTKGLARRVSTAAHLLEQQLLLTAPKDVVHQMREALKLSLSPGSPWLLWSAGGVGRSRGGASLDDTHNDAVSAPPSGGGSADGVRSNVGQDLLLMFLPGSASLYYGDEIDVDVPLKMKWLDWASIMAWTGEQRAGFSTQDPWLDLGPLHVSHNAAVRRPSSVSAVANLAQHKRIEPPLFIKSLLGFEGDYHPTHSSNIKVRYVDEDMLILERFYPRRRQYSVVVNLGGRVVTRDLSHYYYGGYVVASSHNNTGYIEFRNIQLQPSEVLVCVLDK